MRIARLGALIGPVAAVVLAGCPRATRVETPPPIPAAPTALGLVEIEGLFELVVGDPVAGGAPIERYAVVGADGRRTLLMAHREQVSALGPRARTPGARVRVAGTPARGPSGETALQVVTLVLLEEARP